jgi:predicted XRE-type DNA-binding protein
LTVDKGRERVHGERMTQIRSAAGSDARQEKSTGTLRIVADIREYLRLSKLHGGLLPQSFVATILGVSRQRVHQLVEEGTFSHWTFYGMKWLSQEEVMSFARLNRQQGENQYKPSTKQLWKDARAAGKEFVRNRKPRGRSGS